MKFQKLHQELFDVRYWEASRDLIEFFMEGYFDDDFSINDFDPGEIEVYGVMHPCIIPKKSDESQGLVKGQPCMFWNDDDGWEDIAYSNSRRNL